MRYGVGLPATAAIANTTFMDAGQIADEDKRIRTFDLLATIALYKSD